MEFDREKLQRDYNNLFNVDGSVKTSDPQLIIDFCTLLSKITGVQCCNRYGNVYEYLPEVYESVLNLERKE